MGASRSLCLCSFTSVMLYFRFLSLTKSVVSAVPVTSSCGHCVRPVWYFQNAFSVLVYCTPKNSSYSGKKKKRIF